MSTAQTTAARPSRWARLSLAVRVTAAATLIIGFALAAGATLLVVTLRAGLVDSIDTIAAQRARDVSALVADGRVPTTTLPAVQDRTEVQILAPDGTVVTSSEELAGVGALAPTGASAARTAPDAAEQGGQVRVLGVPAGPGERLTVVVTSPLDEVAQAVGRLITALAIGLPILLVVLAAVIYVLARFTLRTVERLRRQVAVVTATDLHRRVEVPPAQDEVRALALTMNQVLARLEDAATVQRRFVADAAHELRSPLAALHAQLEVGARRGDPEVWIDSVPRMITDTERLARLVDDLLALARLDERSRPPRRVLVDLDEIVFAQVREVRQSSTVTVRTDTVSAGLVSGDPDLLTRVVRNLLDNAVRYAATTVEVSLAGSATEVVLVIADDGPGIPAPDRDRVFHRFERLDDARDRDSGGSGLGLAIVGEAVEAHRGVVSIDDNHPGARFDVRFPSVDGEEPDQLASTRS